MAKKDHKVEVTTRNGDKLAIRTTAEEAREFEEAALRDTSNILITSVTPPAGEIRG